MPNALDQRPLPIRLNARIEKYTNGPLSPLATSPLATDIKLHQQSIEAINELLAVAAEALNVIDRIKPEGNGSGTQARLRRAIEKYT